MVVLETGISARVGVAQSRDMQKFIALCTIFMYFIASESCLDTFKKIKIVTLFM